MAETGIFAKIAEFAVVVGNAKVAEIAHTSGIDESAKGADTLSLLKMPSFWNLPRIFRLPKLPFIPGLPEKAQIGANAGTSESSEIDEIGKSVGFGETNEIAVLAKIDEIAENVEIAKVRVAQIVEIA